MRVNVQNQLNALAASVPDASITLEERLDYIFSNSQVLEESLAKAEQIISGVALCEQGQILADLIWDEYQISQENYDGLKSVGDALAYLVVIEHSRFGMPEVRAKVESALKHSSDRIEAIRSYQTRVKWFVNIAATLLGIGAMRAVMAIPAVANLGRTGATIVGSLAFTTTRLVVTNNQGRDWSVGGFVEDAAKDYFLLRLLGGVDARIAARVGDTGVLAAAARGVGAYATLVGWTLTWNAIQPGAPGPTGSHGPSTGDVLVQTGVDLAVLMIAESMLRAPVISDSQLTTNQNADNFRKAKAEWEATRQQLESTGQQLRKWLDGQRENVQAGDLLLERASLLFKRTKSLHARFAEIGEITDAQRGQLDGLADSMLESIRNARDEVRLDVRNVTAETWSYRGTNENISAYLEQLKSQGRIQEVNQQGNGIFSIRSSDGSLHWFYPAGREAPVVLDVVAEAVEAAAPTVAEATRSQALVNLRGANWSDLGTLAGGLPPARGAAFVEWVARPDVGLTIANDNVPMEVVRAISKSSPEALDAIARDEANSLGTWFRSWSAQHPNRPANEFLTALLDIIGWRGTMEVSSPLEATATPFSPGRCRTNQKPHVPVRTSLYFTRLSATGVFAPGHACTPGRDRRWRRI